MPQHQSRETYKAQDEATAVSRENSRENCSTCGVFTGVLSAVLAGGITYGLLQMLYPVFSIPQELIDRTPPGPLLPELQAELTAAKSLADFRNAILFVGFLGALMAGTLAMGTGIGNRYFSKLLVSTAACLVIGALLGCVAGGLGQVATEFLKNDDRFTPLLKTVLSQAAMLASLGAGVGLAYGAFAKQDRSPGPSMVQGLLAGVAAALIYPIIIALLHPAANTSLLVPKEAVSRLAWTGIAALLMGLLIPCSLSKTTSGESCTSGSNQDAG